jgi:hypothetical protein
VRGLTPLKMLHRGIEAIFSVSPGGDDVLINRNVQMIKGDMPAILCLRVSQMEQPDLCLGRDAGVVGIENEATKNDDAEVPIHLWNDWQTRPWRSLAVPDDIIDEDLNKKLCKAAYTIRNKFVLPWWKKNVRRSCMTWFKTTHRTLVNLNPPPT